MVPGVQVDPPETHRDHSGGARGLCDPMGPSNLLSLSWWLGQALVVSGLHLPQQGQVFRAGRWLLEAPLLLCAPGMGEQPDSCVPGVAGPESKRKWVLEPCSGALEPGIPAPALRHFPLQAEEGIFLACSPGNI